MISLATANAFNRSGKFVNKLSLNYLSDADLETPLIEQVCSTLWERRGKRLRSHFVFWFGEMAGIDPAQLHLYAWAAEVVHTATLLHDDVIDQADLRRGGKSANLIFDNTLPILSGDYLLSSALQRLAEEGNLELFRLLCKTIKEICQGEVLQYQMGYQIPTSQKDYEKVVRLKTSSLFLWCAVVGPTLGSGINRKAVVDFIESFGFLFQLTDDLLDVVGSSTKSKWTDLKEGKLNLVTWQLLQASPELRSRTEEQFAKRMVDSKLIASFESQVSKKRIQKQIRERLSTATELARDRLAKFPPGEIKSALHGLVGFCADRCL